GGGSSCVRVSRIGLVEGRPRSAEDLHELWAGDADRLKFGRKRLASTPSCLNTLNQYRVGSADSPNTPHLNNSWSSGSAIILFERQSRIPGSATSLRDR